MYFRILVPHMGSVQLQFLRTAHVRESPHSSGSKPSCITFPTTTPQKYKSALAVQCFRPVNRCFLQLCLKAIEHANVSRGSEIWNMERGVM